MLFNFALEYAITRVQVNQDGLKLDGTHQLLVYADDVNILGGSIHTIQKNTEALLVGGKENGLEVNADETKYVVMFGDQNAGRSHNISIDYSFFEKAEEFRYLGTTLTNQNCIQEETDVDRSQGIFAIIRCRIFCFPGCCLKIQR